jgi:hypothetical protein
VATKIARKAMTGRVFRVADLSDIARMALSVFL